MSGWDSSSVCEGSSAISGLPKTKSGLDFGKRSMYLKRALSSAKSASLSSFLACVVIHKIEEMEKKRRGSPNWNPSLKCR